MDPLVIMKLGKQQQKVEFLVDTEATYSVLNKELAPTGKDYIVAKVLLARVKRRSLVSL